jgi:hypothetical protein
MLLLARNEHTEHVQAHWQHETTTKKKKKRGRDKQRRSRHCADGKTFILPYNISL